VLVALLGSSGLIRLGAGAGEAFALVSEPAAPAPAAICEPPPDTSALLAALRAREAAVKDREARLQDHAQSVALAQEQLDLRLAELVAAEEKLAETMSVANHASEEDVARLVTLYENMKPKDAAAVFGQMAPEFAAGFLARMRPDAAAAVLAGLDPKDAYTISVMFAGRNANAPRN
jgi:flagellar motility protein MotE (MotC chaperone)